MTETDCPFCRVEEDRIIAANEAAIAFPDGFPLTEGHTLVIPRRHVVSLFDLPTDEQSLVWSLVAQVRTMLHGKFSPDGFNIGLNDGPAAGQTIMRAHIHVIPRRHGDMPDPRGGVRWVLPSKAAYWLRDAS